MKKVVKKSLDSELEYIIVAAIRYQLPRQTYGSGIVSNFVLRNWDAISTPTKENIARDISEAFDRFHKGETYALGSECDREEFEKILIKYLSWKGLDEQRNENSF